MLNHKWAATLNALFAERGLTEMCVQRFDLGNIPLLGNAIRGSHVGCAASRRVRTRSRSRAGACAASARLHDSIAGSAHRRAAPRRGGARHVHATEQAVLQVSALSKACGKRRAVRQEEEQRQRACHQRCKAHDIC
eukprot:1159938-Rhodomonas_salina.1